MSVPSRGKKRKGCDSRASSAYDFVLVRLFRGAQLVNGIVLIDTESQAKSNPAHIIGQMEIEPERSLEQCLGIIRSRYDLANSSEGHEGCEPIATPKVFKLFKVTNEMKIVSKVGAIHVVQKRLCLEVTDISAIKLRVGLLLEFVQVSTDVLDEHVRGGNATTSTSYSSWHCRSQKQGIKQLSSREDQCPYVDYFQSLGSNQILRRLPRMVLLMKFSVYWELC